MKFLAACFATVVLCLAPALRAETPEDRYVEIYSWIEEADQLLGQGEKRLAAEKYQEAQAGLKDLQKNYPNWNPNVVKFRLTDLASKLAPLAHFLPESADTVLPAAIAPAPSAPGAEAQQLRQEVARLKTQNTRLEARLREALSVQPAAVDPRQVAKAGERLKQIEKERDLLAAMLEEERAKNARPTASRGEKGKSLEEQLAAALAAMKSAQASAREALAERDSLAKKLEKATADLEKAAKELDRRGQQGSIRESEIWREELNAIQTRLAAYESMPAWFNARNPGLDRKAPVLLAATQVPALPKASVVSTNASTNGTPARKKYDLPSGAGALFADVERAVDAGRYAEAEKTLRDILRQDENNVRILDKLGAVQMDQDKAADAEVTLKRALTIDPEDPAALYLLGSLKLRQEKKDEALDLLKLSAKIEPDMPQTQYFLGRAFVQKGDRRAGEAALRKAIQLKPNWGEPHYMLAVIYGTEQPPYNELARFHYKKAIAGGATRNPDLEKRIDNPAAPVKP